MAGSHGRELWFDTDLGDEYKDIRDVYYLCMHHVVLLGLNEIIIPVHYQLDG